MTLSVAITHAHHLPERVESYKRLRATLELGSIEGHLDIPGVLAERAFGGPEPRAAWSEAQWLWSLETGAEHCLFLQDDVLAAPAEIFWPTLEDITKGHGKEDVVSFYSSHQAARILARWGDYGWYSLSDHVGGPAYLMPRALLSGFLAWRKESLHEGAKEYLAEDDQIALFLMSTGRRCFYPVMSIADHDHTLDSAFGFGPSLFRRSAVRWDEPLGVLMGANRQGCIHLGHFHEAMAYQARHWVKGWTEAQTRRILGDRCPPEYDVQRWALRP